MAERTGRCRQPVVAAAGHAEDHEQMMLALGLRSKRIARTKIRVRTAMAAQNREQGR